MGKAWSDAAIRNLTDWTKCPRCDFSPLTEGWCGNCGADLRGPVALELANASEAAVSALRAREAVLARVPVTAAMAQAAQTAQARVVAPPAAPQPAAAPRATSQISLQSMLAVAGAGMVAVAAIVFTFINPVIADDIARYSIVGGITLIFLGAAWLMARGGLQFSAEAIGALGMVFVVIDIWAIATKAESSLSDYAIAAIATVVVSALLIVFASIRRLRTWLWSGALGLIVTPLLVGWAVDSEWSHVLGWLGLTAVALAVHELLHPLEGRFKGKLLADHGTATVLQFLGLLVTVVWLFTVSEEDTVRRVLSIAAVLAGLGLLAALSTRNGLVTAWSSLAGGLLTAAATALPFAATYQDEQWLVALPPVAAFAAVVVLASFSLLVPKQSLARDPLLAGALTVAFVAVVPAAGLIAAQAASVQFYAVEPLWGAAAVVGAAAAALGLMLVAFARRSSVFATLAVVFALCTVIGVSTWTQFVDVTKFAIAVGSTVVIAAALAWLKPLAGVRPAIRVTLHIGAHILLALAILISWAEDSLTIFGGIAIVIAFAFLAFAVPRAVQPVHVALGFAYGLIVFAYTLHTKADLSDYAVLGLTATLGLVVAIAVTLIRQVAVRFYYAVLMVAALPFLAAVTVTLSERSGWTGLAVGAAFVLALTTVLVRRPGLTTVVRAGGAALLLPTLSVVVIDVVPQIIETSASPIVLPVIAGLVAITLPSTVWIGAALKRLGHSGVDAKAVQLALEISALATGAIAALLAVWRVAAGADTTFIVLTIIGIGAAATGQFVHRRYAWYVAYISFTGALWALLALNSVDQVESYVLPPAIVAALIGVYAVARGARGLVFYIAGLSVAVATSLGVLIVQGNPDGLPQLRAFCLLAASLLLIVVGWLIARIPEKSRFTRLTTLHATTLWVAIGAAAAGTVQAMRYGIGVDVSTFGTGEGVIVPVLGFSAAAAALAALAGWLLAKEHAALAASRWLYVPALVCFAVGPITAFRYEPEYPITMLAITVAVLALMLATVTRSRVRAVTLPPVWFTFAVATAIGIAGWQNHQVFRVEAFSLPLGLALLAAGIIAWRPVEGATPTLNRWPIGFTGSWWLLAPGILVILATSVMSTGTDPLTWRAILVIGLALVAILIGNLRKLAAPFILGLAALPLENIVVFAVQIGDKIDAAQWWITLATAGATLLVLAISSERGSTGDRGVAARLRDLK